VLSTQQARIDCSTTFTEKYNTIVWNSPLASPTTSGPGSSKTYSTVVTGAVLVNVSAQVCYLGVCIDSNTVVVQVPGTPSSVTLGVDTSDGIALVAQVIPGGFGGTVTFYQVVGSSLVTLGTLPIDATGLAVWWTPPPTLVTGQTYQFKAHYSGAGIVAPGDSAVISYFVKASPTVTLSVTYNTDLTTRISVTVAGPGGTPSGSVALTYTNCAFTPLGTIGTIALTGGSGVFPAWTPPLSWSGYILANYPGDALFTQGSGSRDWPSGNCF
jgi:hypothetical protein